MAQLVKNLLAMRMMWVPFLGWNDLEKGMTTLSSNLDWIIPWTSGLVGYSPSDRKKLETTEQLSLFNLC